MNSPISSFCEKLKLLFSITLLASAFLTFPISLMGSTSAELSWDPSPDENIIAYNVYYGTESGNYDNKLTLGNVSSAVISGLQNGTTYYFAVTSGDVWGSESEFSNEVSSDSPASETLLLLANEGPTSQAVELAWNPSSMGDVYAYIISYGTESGIYDKFTAFFNATDAVIYGLGGGTTNYFVVSAIGYHGVEIDLSNEASYVTPQPEPIVLQTGSGPVSQAVELTWSPSSNADVYAYNIYSRTESGVYDNSAFFHNVNTAVIYGLTGGSTNYFVVSAVSYDGTEVDFSNEASFVTPEPETVVLHTQTLLDDNGQPAYLVLTSTGDSSGQWDIEYSTDLQNWNYYAGGSDVDVNIYVWLDPNESRMFFRLKKL